MEQMLGLQFFPYLKSLCLIKQVGWAACMLCDGAQQAEFGAAVSLPGLVVMVVMCGG